MARSRNIKPGFYKNEDLAECSIWARFIFPGLWMLADRDGVLEDRPKRIKGELLPFDTVDVEPLLVELVTRKFIERIEFEGTRLIRIINFAKHQNPHYSEKPSGLMPANFQESGGDDGGNDPGNDPDKGGGSPNSSGDDGALKRGQNGLIPDSLLLIPDSLIPDSGKKRKRAPAKTTLPDDFGVSEAVRQWAKGKNFGDLDRHLESFRQKCVAKGYTYANWDAAFRGAITDDWARLRVLPQHQQQKGNVHDRRAATLAAFASKPAERDITADSETLD